MKELFNAQNRHQGMDSYERLESPLMIPQGDYSKMGHKANLAMNEKSTTFFQTL